MAAAFLVLALISTIQPTVAVSVESGSVLSRDLATNLKERPVMKVVRLLKDMEAELNKELEDDKQVYEMLSCWCQTNEKEKTKAIELGTSTAAELEASLSADAAKVVALKAKRKDTMDEMYADQKALGQANELRIKENKAFQAEKVDLIEAIKACEQAVTVLSKHHPGSHRSSLLHRCFKRLVSQSLSCRPACLGVVGRECSKISCKACSLRRLSLQFLASGAMHPKVVKYLVS